MRLQDWENSVAAHGKMTSTRLTPLKVSSLHVELMLTPVCRTHWNWRLIQSEPVEHCVGVKADL